MRVHLVSDVHGNFDALARLSDTAEVLLILGDLVDYVDYLNHDRGILGALFGAEKVSVYAKIRREGTPQELDDFSQSLWGELSDPAAAVEEVIRTQYKAAFDAMTTETYLIPGNVDVPQLWPEFAKENVHFPDGEIVEFNGMKFGFVGGGRIPEGAVLDRTAPWVPYLREPSEFDTFVGSMSRVDVLCSHIPPHRPELVYDVVARRGEIGSRALHEYVRDRQPNWSFFGHVHQPISARLRIGKTECRNLGFFQATERSFVLTL